VTSQKARAAKKPAAELTTDEAMKRLFHPDVIKHANEHAKKAEERGPKAGKKSMSEQ
jgi:hypothetical protein